MTSSGDCGVHGGKLAGFIPVIRFAPERMQVKLGRRDWTVQEFLRGSEIVKEDGSRARNVTGRDEKDA